MSNENQISRSNGQGMDDSWANTIRRILLEGIFPRNSNGIVTDQAGSLGTDAYRWLAAHFMSLNLSQGSNSISIIPPSGLSNDRTFVLPAALPTTPLAGLIISNTGALSFASFSRIHRTQADYISNVKTSSSSGNFGTTSGSFVDVTNLSITITTTGRPVHVFLKGDGSGAGATVFLGEISGGSLRVMRDSTEVYRFTTGVAGQTDYAHHPLKNGDLRDPVPAGTYTYKVQVMANGGGTASIEFGKIVVFEAA